MSRLWVVNLILGCSIAAQEPQKITPGSLTLEDVIGFSKTGVGEELIITRVKQNAKAFNLNPDEIRELKNFGVSETVIQYLLDPTRPYAPPAPSPPTSATGLKSPVAPTKPPSDPLALKVPPESGIFHLIGKDDFRGLDLKPVMPYKKPSKIASVLSGGMLKGHVVGSVIGGIAKARAARGSGIFYARLGDKGSIDDVVLLSLQSSRTRRDLDFGTRPGKPAFPVNSVRQFESKEVSPGLFRLSVPLKQPGEYFFFLLGSADEKKGLLGKGYDFGVD